MLDMLEKHLQKIGVFENNMPKIVQNMSNSISNDIPYRMKLTFAISELMLFISQFRINIKHWNNSVVPINGITFCIAPSGTAKDSSLKSIRKCFAKAYDSIDTLRKEKAIQQAILQATEAGDDAPTNWNVYSKYYIAPNPLFVAPSTTEGFIQHLNDIDTLGIGAGYMFSGELGAELTSSATFTDNIKVISELYDVGNKEVKVLKDRSLQTREIESLAVSAMFMGSQDNILYDDVIKRKFKTEFTTKLARRSFFIFIDEIEEKEENISIENLIYRELNAENMSNELIQTLDDTMLDITNELFLLKQEEPDIHVTVSNEVRELFIVYKEFNRKTSERINIQFPMTKLTRTHMQWKALKLAGALALIRFSTEIKLEDYKAAIEFVEYISNDIIQFEKELVKEPYELFVKYAKEACIDNKAVINLHTLRKMGYLQFKGNPTQRMKELVQLASSYDDEGVYQMENDSILYKKLDKTDVILLSYVECTGTKEQRVKKCDKGYVCEELHFEDLTEMLKGDFAYSPFKFIDGVRGKNNIESTCKWYAFDVDTSTITDEEASILLSDIKHIIVRTSNKDNAYKFRILVEFDVEADIPSNVWNKFLQSIANELMIDIDILPKSQIFFSYADRIQILNLEAEPLSVKNHISYAINYSEAIEEKTKISTKDKKNLLSDPISTFAQAYDAKQGEGSRKLIWAAKYAKELGASKDEVIALIHDINQYWIKPLPETRLTNTILSQIFRWTF